MAKPKPRETKLKGVRAAETDWKSFTDQDVRAAIRDNVSTAPGTRDRKMAAERELAMRHTLPDGTRLRVAPFEVDVEVNTSTGPRWAEVATFDEACSVLYHLATEVAAGDTIDDDVELPDGHDLRVRDGAIELQVRESWARGRWVQLAGDEEAAELLAVFADEAATGTTVAAGSADSLVNGGASTRAPFLRERSGIAEVRRWYVYLDGKREPKSYVETSEDAALALWARHTGRHTVARSRLRMEPAEEETEEGLTAEEEHALRGWAAEQGRTWKAELRAAWETGNYHGSEHDSALQRLRNRLGPSWLATYRMVVEEGENYRCWVVRSTSPRAVDTWDLTRRKDAVAAAKKAVREHGTEGGVESYDPAKPFEQQYAMEQGRLLTTTF